MNPQYDVLENDYAVGPDFYLPIESFIGCHPKDEGLILSFTGNKTITIPKTQSTLAFVAKLCKRHSKLNPRESMDQEKDTLKEVKGFMGRIQGDGNIWMWFYFDEGPDHGIPIPLEAVKRVVTMIDSFVYDEYRKYESRLVQLTDSNHRMGISLLPIKKKVKMWYQMDKVHSFVITFEQLLKIKDVLLCFLI